MCTKGRHESFEMRCKQIFAIEHNEHIEDFTKASNFITLNTSQTTSPPTEVNWIRGCLN